MAEISKTELRSSLREVLDEHLPDQSEKDRRDLEETLIDRLEVDFGVFDDEDAEEIEAEVSF